MKFALMYEIEMPKPWYEGQEYEKYWQVMAQIQYAEEMGFDYVWAVEHHGLEEVLALLRAGDPVRGRRSTHQPHSFRPWRGVAAATVQSSDSGSPSGLARWTS